MLPANTLILELTDGLYIWPPSSHIRRTASGAVPSSIPEPASILDGEACTSHQECHIKSPYISGTVGSELAESMRSFICPAVGIEASSKDPVGKTCRWLAGPHKQEQQGSPAARNCRGARRRGSAAEARREGCRCGD